MSDDPSPSPTERVDVAALISAWRKILGFSRPYLLRLIPGLVLTLLATGIWLAVPLGIRSLLDSVFEEADRALLNLLGLVMLGLFVLLSLMSFGGHYLIEWTGSRVVTDLRQRVYAHLHTLGLRFFANRRLGELTSRLTSDVEAIRSAATSDLAQLTTQVFSLVGSVIVMASLNWRLSLVVFGSVPAVAIGTRYFGQKIRKLSRQVQDRLAETTATAEEALSAIRLVKAYTREAFEVGRYHEEAESLFQVARYRALITAVFSSAMGFLFLLALVVIFWYGGHEVLEGRLSAGDLVAFIIYASNITRSVWGVSRLYSSLNTAVGASERIFELLDLTPEIEDAPGATELPSIVGRVAFEGVSFAYEDDRRVLDDVSFTAEPGSTVAVVGPSGAGKTTLLNLIPRFYDPVDGRIAVDGVDLRTVTIESLRQQIAVVSQDVYLFGNSVADNIRYGRLQATDTDVEAAALAANAGGFIQALPEGYATRVGERGVKLSGGQRQRISIARALLRDARILLLDEATSSLDSEAEATIQEALERLTEGRTTFIVAHRLSTVQIADRILVLEDGKRVQWGTHGELLREEGVYRRLCERQFWDAGEGEVVARDQE